MPTLKESSQRNLRIDRSQMKQSPLAQQMTAGEAQAPIVSGFNGPPAQVPVVLPSPSMFLRCPLPGIKAYPDGLRQYYSSGVPQTRLIPVD